MKILFSQSYYLPYISGLTIYAQRITQGLSSAGNEVEILTSLHKKDLKENDWDGKVRLSRIFPQLKFNKGLLMLSWPVVSLKKAFLSDAVICNLPQAEGFWPLLWGKILKKKTVVVYTCEVFLPKGIVNKIVEKGLFVCNFFACALAGKIVCYTKDYAENSKMLKHFKNKQVYILPPVVLGKENKDITGEISKRISRKKEEVVIGFAARIAAEKGLEYLIEAVPLVEKLLNKSVIIAIAGPQKEVLGEEKYFEKISRLIKQTHHKIIFLGSFPPEEMISFYKNIDILVLPSVNSTEAFGMVQAEAMLAGVPVVATDLPGVRMPVRLTGMGEIVEIKNTEKLAESITKVVKNKKAYLRNKSEIEKIFNYKQTISGFEDMIKK